MNYATDDRDAWVEAMADVLDLAPDKPLSGPCVSCGGTGLTGRRCPDCGQLVCRECVWHHGSDGLSLVR